MKKAKGLFKLLRFELPVSAGICVVLGQILASDGLPPAGIIIAGFLSIFFISSSILVMNDYFDVETDRINSPERPIPANLIKPFEALSFGILLLFIGLLTSYFLGIAVFIISVILAIVGFIYNRFFKKSGIWGNLMVSFSVGMTFIFGGASVGNILEKSVLFFAVIAALIDLGEEIAADAMDAEGDRLIDSKSIAIRYGQLTSLKISVGIFLSVIFLSFLPFLFGWFNIIYLLPILIMDASIGYSCAGLLSADIPKGRKLIKIVYLGSTLGLVMFILLKFIN